MHRTFITNPKGTKRSANGLRPFFRLNRLHGTERIEVYTLAPEHPSGAQLLLRFVFADGSEGTTLYSSRVVFDERIAGGRAFAYVPVWPEGIDPSRKFTVYETRANWNGEKEDGGTYSTRKEADRVASDYRTVGYQASSVRVRKTFAELVEAMGMKYAKIACRKQQGGE